MSARAASAKGAFEAARMSAGTTSITALHARAQSNALASVPATVARGTTRSGSSILSAGTAADSNPTTAQSASVAAAAVPSKDTGGPEVAALSHSGRQRSAARAGITTSGTLLSTVVTDCTHPAARTPRQLTSVNSH